jgi:hypothetical protein
LIKLISKGSGIGNCGYTTKTGLMQSGQDRQQAANMAPVAAHIPSIEQL